MTVSVIGELPRDLTLTQTDCGADRHGAGAGGTKLGADKGREIRRVLVEEKMIGNEITLPSQEKKSFLSENVQNTLTLPPSHFSELLVCF